jgi:hypothetical protein
MEAAEITFLRALVCITRVDDQRNVKIKHVSDIRPLV